LECHIPIRVLLNCDVVCTGLDHGSPLELV